MKKFYQSAIVAIIFITSINFALAAESLHVGEGVYQFAESAGFNKEPINIYYYRPKNWKVGDKILVEFHGIDRNPQLFTKNLHRQAEQKNFLLICPEFTKAKFPGNKFYNYGNVLNPKKSEWTYNVANRIIDDLKNRTGSSKSKIIFFGHSAGGQFLHRYLFFADKIKADKIIAANAGLYFMPDENTNFPHGMKNTSVTDRELKRAYSQDVIIMLGENDVNRDSKYFPKSAKDDKQGLTRFERGKNFFAKSQVKAKRLGTKFNWRLVKVPNVGHDGLKMIKQAMRYI